MSEEIKGINPYMVGQKLTFVSSTGIESTLKITTIEDGRFPDGLGAFFNEHLNVIAHRKSKTDRNGEDEIILAFLAKTKKYEERIDFNISLEDTYLQMPYVNFATYQSQDRFKLTTNFGSYDDVLLFKNYPNRKIYESEIVEFYWSKSIGYVRLVQKDGTLWDLKSPNQSLGCDE